MTDYQKHVITQIPKLNNNVRNKIEKHTLKFSYNVSTHKHQRCVLCMDDFKNGDTCLKLPCGHVFHKAEAEKYLYSKQQCPLCRQHITTCNHEH